MSGSSDGSAAPLSSREKLATALPLSAAIFLVLSPAINHVFGGRQAWVRSWKMFSGVGLGLHEVHYYHQVVGGDRTRLDRFVVLGKSAPDRAPGWLKNCGRTTTSICFASAPYCSRSRHVTVRYRSIAGYRFAARVLRDYQYPLNGVASSHNASLFCI